MVIQEPDLLLLLLHFVSVICFVALSFKRVFSPREFTLSLSLNKCKKIGEKIKALYYGNLCLKDFLLQWILALVEVL